MNPIGATLTIIFSIMLMGSSRKIAALAMLAGMMFVTQNQQIQVGGFNMFASRIFGVVVFFRVLAKGEFSFSRMVAADKIFLTLHLASTVIYVARSTEGNAYTIATALDMLFAYFGFRGLIQNLEDLRAILLGLVPMLVIYCGLVLFESVTHKNLFSLLGAPNMGWVRNGRLRCFGSFRNPDLLGTLGATFMPLYIGMMWLKEYRKRCLIAILACLLIVVSCNSGGPMSAMAFALVGWCLWKIKYRMQTVRRGLLGFVILAALLMKAPVWYLIARISSITGGDGWHRSYLLDVCFQHISMWWFCGMDMRLTWDWFPYGLVTTGAADITNVFVAFGLQAGISMIVVLIWMLAAAFKSVGAAFQVLRARFLHVTHDEIMLWGLGVTLAAHIINWFGITYFDQSYIMWCMHLGALVSVSTHVVYSAPEEANVMTLQLEPVSESEDEFAQFEPL